MLQRFLCKRWLPVLGLAAITAVSGYAGGMWLTFAKTEANPAAKATPGALAVVRMEGCHDPAKARYSGTAEGLVRGDRKSIPLEFVAGTEPGVYVIRQKLEPGAWVLNIHADNQGGIVNALVPVEAGQSFDRKSIKVSHEPIPPQEVEAALRSHAGFGE